MRETERRGRKEWEGKGNLAPRSFIKVGAYTLVWQDGCSEAD